MFGFLGKGTIGIHTQVEWLQKLQVSIDSSSAVIETWHDACLAMLIVNDVGT